MGQSPLKTQFPDLFRICDDPTILVSDCLAEDGWGVKFRRSLSPSEHGSWEGLAACLENVVLDPDSRDEVTWALDSTKSFTIKSLYRFMTNRGVSIPESEDV